MGPCSCSGVCVFMRECVRVRNKIQVVCVCGCVCVCVCVDLCVLCRFPVVG